MDTSWITQCHSPGVAAFAASLPLLYAPDRYMAYSSGTTNIISRALARITAQQVTQAAEELIRITTP